MAEKEPVILAILVDTFRMRWLVGGIGFDGQTYPLLVSHDGDLAEYEPLEFDEQASFLRHRFCGTLQRGCDRLWGIRKKACHFIFVTDRILPDSTPELTDRVAEHLVQWMTNPPVTFFKTVSGSFQNRPVALSLLAGEIPDDRLSVLDGGLPQLLDASDSAELWELVPRKQSKTT